MDRFEANYDETIGKEICNLHSSMDRFEVTVKAQGSEYLGNLHSSMDRFEGTIYIAPKWCF